MKRSKAISVLLLGVVAAVVVWFLAGDRGPDEVDPLDVSPDTVDGAPRDPGMLETGDDTAPDGAPPVDAGPDAFLADGPVRWTGTVVDDRDRPIAGATVRKLAVDARGLRGAPYPDRDVEQTTTDREGRFAFESQFVGGWVRLVASAAGRATVGVLIASHGTDVVIRLPGAGSLAVDVLDEDGNGVSAATIDAYQGDTRLAGSSSAEGKALLEAVPPGDVRLRVSAEGYGTVRAGPVRVRQGAPSTLTVVLTRGVRVAGTILDDATGKPLAGAQVHVAHPGRSDAADPTGPDGRFGPLPGGGLGERVFLAVSADGYTPALEPVVLHAKDVQSVVVRLEVGDAWTGRVEPPTAGNYLRNRVLVGYTSDGTAGRAPIATQADGEGRFTLPPPPDPLPGRRVVLYARGPDGSSAALALRPGMVRPDPLVLRLRGGTAVTGSVRDTAGKALAGVQVRLTPVWDRAGSRNTPDPETSLLLLANEDGFTELSGASRADGAWMIRNVAAGSYEVRYRWQGGQHWRTEPLQVEGASVSAGTETLGAGLRIAGRVRDGRGAPASGATIRIAARDTPRHVHRATADADGYYAVSSVPAGTYAVRAFLGSFEPIATEVELQATRDDVDLDFEPSAVVNGRLDGPGAPYSGPISLRLQRPRGGGARPPQTVIVKGGRFRWKEVPGGTWRVSGRIPGGAFAFSDERIEVEAGRITDLVLTLQDPAAIAGRVVGADGPAPSARIQLTDEDGGRRRLATADANGAFRIDGLEPGTWHARVWGRGGAPTEQTLGVEAGKTRTVEWRLAPAGRARVTVVDARDRPVAGAVVLFRSGGGPLPASRPDRTGRDGRVERDGLPVGALLVLARDASGTRGQAQTVISANERSEVRITLINR